MGPVFGIVVAGGAGTRFGQPKQFADLAGRPVVEWSVRACRSVCDTVVLVLPAGHLDLARSAGLYCADLVVAGGPTRADSVRSGLRAVPADADVVVVHDAARPLARAELFSRVLGALDDGAPAAVCPVAVTDTVKRVRPSGAGQVVAETLRREELVSVQTPQAFRADVLRRAHEGAPDATDDAALVEAAGGTVVVVAGDPDNLKLTTPADLARAVLLVGG
jgi:2-C-methyl-D-erythritol 4-phosphate cytidylyltransferase